MTPTDDEATRDPISGIIMLEDDLPYLDGSEQPIHDAIDRSDDTSSWSDELWRQASTWPERYHLSPQRGSIIAPLLLGPGSRVLEVGAGTGAVTRAIGETGASVTAVEGNLDRARIVEARCSDLPNVNVVCGPATSFDEPGTFDVVIGIGILEYSSTGSGGSSGPEALLAHLARQLADDGVLVIAIENQVGLKYLIGYNEDHLGLPWVGVEGYQRGDGPRTWSKRALGEMFDSAGLPVQHWAFPFPDYKFPRVILDESVYDEPDATALVDVLCGRPASDSAEEPHLLCDSRTAHRVLLDAGLGPSIANSFMVVAGRDQTAIGQHVRPALAWLTGSRRRSTWQRWRELRPTGDGRAVVVIRSSGHSRQLAWLRQEEPNEVEWVDGRSLESILLDSIAAGNDDAIREVLIGWMSRLAEQATDASGRDVHPFIDGRTTRVLPGDMIDANFSNWVVRADGTYELIDREWVADAGADIDLVAARALLYVAHAIIVNGAAHPWSPTATVREIASTLGTMCGLGLTDELLDRWVTAESALQSIIQDVDREQMEPIERRLLSTSRLDPAVRKSLPFVTLQRDLGTAAAELQSLRQTATTISELQREVWSARDYTITVASEISDLRRENLTLTHEYQAVLHHIEGLEKIREHQQELYASTTWRLGSFLLRPFRLLEGIRSIISRTPPRTSGLDG